MHDHWHTITEWAQHASTFRKLKAYGISADGSRQPLDCEAIDIELDEERGLIVSLAERMAGEGVAICSLPQGQPPSEPSDPERGEHVPSGPSPFSVLVMRSGGANLLYLSPECHGQAGERR
ncbi:MAG: hypothetical protein VKL58_04880 [Cyanobacteriota bacterium]|nr:hypothetical protein [Cyanobacteriota bacterium]